MNSCCSRTGQKSCHPPVSRPARAARLSRQCACLGSRPCATRWCRPCLTAAARACNPPPRIPGRAHRAELGGWDEEDAAEPDSTHNNKRRTSGSEKRIAGTAVPVRPLHLETLDKLGASADADSATVVDSTTPWLLEGKEGEEGGESYRHALRENLPCSTLTLHPAPYTLRPGRIALQRCKIYLHPAGKYIHQFYLPI